MNLLKSWRVRIALVLSVVGPGFITANVDNDAGGIWTYSVAGAQFGYSLLWVMIPTTIALVVVQEMASRMGAATGKGLSDLIREEFGFRNYGYLYMVIGLVGTTIAPWMQFYLQASVVEKGVTMRQYRASRWDVIVGCFFAAIVAWFIIVACAATLHSVGRTEIRDAADAAQALRPLAGEYAYLLFAAGLFNASLFAASVLPISTAYAVCEGLGFESGLDKKFHEAPVFYWLYTLIIVVGAGVLLVPRFPLAHIMVLSQVVNGIVLPFVLIFMLLLINDRELMGAHVNTRGFNVVAWLTVTVMIVLTLAMFVTQI